MRLVTLNENTHILLKHEDTRSGFRHLAYLIQYGRDVEEAKCTYQNRTWEMYPFQTVLSKLISNTEKLNEEEKNEAMEIINGGNY